MSETGALAGQRAMTLIALGIWIYCFVAFAGVAITDEGRMDRYTSIVIAHGLLVMAWLTVFVAQSWAIGKRQFARHMQLGRLSVILVIAMLLVAAKVVIDFEAETGRRGTAVGDGISLAVFLLFYGIALAMARRKAIDWHKRFMLMATLHLLGPAHARFLDVVGISRVWTIGLVLFSTIIPLLALDLIERRKIHRASITAIAIALVLGIGTIYVVFSLASFQPPK